MSTENTYRQPLYIQIDDSGQITFSMSDSNKAIIKGDVNKKHNVDM